MKKINLLLWAIGIMTSVLLASSSEVFAYTDLKSMMAEEQAFVNKLMANWDPKAADDIMNKNCVEKLSWDEQGIKLTLLSICGNWYKVVGLDEQDTLKCVSKTRYYTGGDLHIVGSPSTDTWLLVPQKPGDVRIFFYYMVLEKEKPRRSVILHVHVDENLHYIVGLEAPAES